MGIPGLFSYVTRNNLFELVDIVKIANKNGGIEILVDFNAYIRDLLELLSSIMCEEHDNEYLTFPGGEFDIIYDAIYDFHTVFDEANIKLTWLIDGPKGVDEDASNQKQETWNKRNKSDIERYDKVLYACTHELPPHDLNNLFAPCSFEVCQAALKDVGAEIIQVLQGEADELIALEFSKRNAYAIITNDTDFLIFPHCRVIFPRFMTIHYKSNTKLPFVDKENPGKLFKKPDSFECPVVTEDLILQNFQFNGFDELVVLSILQGSDNISEFAQELQYHLKIIRNPEGRSNIYDVVQYIKDNHLNIKNICLFSPIKSYAKNCPRLIEAINYCNDFYSLKRIRDNFEKSIVIYKPDTFEDLLTDHFAKILSNSELGKEVYAMHFGSFINNVYVESPSKYDSITAILSEIRSRIYPYVVNKKFNEVVEWQPRREEKSVTIPVEHAAKKSNYIKGIPEGDPPDSHINGTDLFDTIWSHLEMTGPLNYFAKFGLECGFICYVLRYFYQITKDRNLHLSATEFRALFVTVFYHFANLKKIKLRTRLNRESFLGMKICPTSQCLIIDTWFLCLIHCAKYLCGGAFNLTHNFPSEKNIFNGSIFFAFYENMLNKQNKRTCHLTDDLKTSIDSLAALIMEMYSNEYRAVTM